MCRPRTAAVLPAALIALACLARAGAAQVRFNVDGRVVVRGTVTGLAGVSVALSARLHELTDSGGSFSFPEVAPGRYTLTVRSIGYAPVDMPLEVSGDTTVVVELDVAPVPIDTLRARAEEVRVRGRVRDPLLDRWLIDADVFAAPDLEDVTDGVGRFDLGDVPAGVPLTIRVESFGYLPATVTFEPTRDTTLAFEMDRDPVAQRMIGQQLEHIDDRLEDRRYEPLPVLDRDELMQRHSGLILDVLRLRLGTYWMRRVACIVLDESPIFQRRIATLHVDRIQRIEVIRLIGYGQVQRLGVRIYTRHFVERMVEGRAELVERHWTLKKINKECY